MPASALGVGIPANGVSAKAIGGPDDVGVAVPVGVASAVVPTGGIGVGGRSSAGLAQATNNDPTSTRARTRWPTIILG